MATVVLQVAGTVIGGAIGGPVGAAVGRAIGAAAGYLIDRELFGPGDRAIEGPRLKNAQFLSSEEGTPISRLYGRARLSGQIIWATRFEEVQETQSQGGKGGPKTHVTNYSYFANFAIGLCEGEIACARRIWVDGKLLNQNDYTIRVYRGDENQLPDSLIEAKQGAGNAPSYRGLAYIVFERLPLERFGNRIPQIAVEVIKPVGQLEKRVKAVALLPGASEFGYDPLPVVEKKDTLTSVGLNTNNTLAASDWIASLDELQAICPNLQSTALITSWFGDDLRVGDCSCQPQVETATREILEGEEWQVSGVSRSSAGLVSLTDGRPAYGGTPSDSSIIRAIQDVHARGLKVTFYPFLLMDIPDTNNLPDPYGASVQPNYPWRGRVTCNPAIGQPSSADKTALAKSQIDAFIGSAQPADFIESNNTITYSGPAEWSYRRFILHYAKLCALAGGVDAFLIGSELRGITRVQDENGSFPFVDHLRVLAGDVRSILGSAPKITYAADWSEYFGYQPGDGSGDVFYNLDPLWADTNIDIVAIDNYMPLSDWRDEGAPDGEGTSSRDALSMSANINAGEGFDWYYAGDDDRHTGTRTPITDGLGKPWVYRFKDLQSWWNNNHIPRVDGVEISGASPWLPQMKPIWFTEIGCPAIDKGANQPNVFVDPKSSESFYPYFSNGNRDDAVQASYLTAHQHHWDPTVPGFQEANNPQATVYSGRMVDAENIHLWAWDVRPYPDFPENNILWSDGENWRLGHWLNGRLGGARLGDVLAAILSDHGFFDFDVSEVHGFADGYAISSLTSARGAIQALTDLYQIEVLEQGKILIFRTAGKRKPELLASDEFSEIKDRPQTIIKRIQEIELPKSVVLEHSDPQLEFRQTATYSRRIEGGSERQVSMGAPLIMPQELALPLVDNWLRAAWIGRNSVQIKMPRRYQQLEVGDQVTFDLPSLTGNWLITRIEDGDDLSVDLRSIETTTTSLSYCQSRLPVASNVARSGLPLMYLMDLPLLSGTNAGNASRVAVSSEPWPGQFNLYSAPDLESYSFRQSLNLRATIGRLNAPVSSGHAGVWDRAGEINVEIFEGTLSAQPELQVLNGANIAAIRSQNGGWEVIQFANATLIGTNTWRLANLLRGQAGTDAEMASGAIAGSPFVLIDRGVASLSYEPSEVGLDLNWKVAASGTAISESTNPGQQFVPGIRGYLPYEPVHLRSELQSGDDIEFTWMRRDRINADAWYDGEIPMSEDSEAYQVKVSSSGIPLRSWQVGEPQLTYSRAEQLADIATFPANITVEVKQLSASHGAGAAASLAVVLQ